MTTTRLREKSQMTVPTGKIVRSTGCGPDELLDIGIVGDAFVVCPQRSTRLNQHHPMHFWGAGRSADNAGADEIDRQIRALRDEWERPA